MPVTAGTFHGIFYGILKWAYRISSQNILSEEEKYQILRLVINSRDADAQDEADFLRDLAEEIGRVKNGRIPVEEYVSDKCAPERFRQITGSMKKSGNPSGSWILTICSPPVMSCLHPGRMC